MIVMSNTLYVIGNGFDIDHQINSRYSDYREYCCAKDKDTYILLNNIYRKPEELWCDFENGLPYIECEAFFKVADHMRIERNLPTDIEIENTADVLCHIWQSMRDWISEVDSTILSKCRKYDFNNLQDSIFLTFNYTTTLETLYKIPHDQVRHIHGCVGRDVIEDVDLSQIIIGHGKSREEIDEIFSECADEKVKDELKCILDKCLRKDTDRIISKDYKEFFEDLSNIDTIYILGHSMAAVDMPYFVKIRDSVKKTAKWNVSIFGDEEIKRRKMSELGADPKLCKYAQICELLPTKCG